MTDDLAQIPGEIYVLRPILSARWLFSAGHHDNEFYHRPPRPRRPSCRPRRRRHVPPWADGTIGRTGRRWHGSVFLLVFTHMARIVL
jgi:hypothetical protein